MEKILEIEIGGIPFLVFADGMIRCSDVESIIDQEDGAGTIDVWAADVNGDGLPFSWSLKPIGTATPESLGWAALQQYRAKQADTNQENRHALSYPVQPMD